MSFVCFSPEMDATAGLFVTAVGIDALRNTRSRDQVAFAALPVLFGVHQLVETIVWLDLQHRLTPDWAVIADLSAWIYLLIAVVIVPVAVPYGFVRLGIGRWPRLDRAFLGFGIAAAAIDAYALGVRDVPREIAGHQITYHLGLPFVEATLLAYVVATCGPGLAARSRHLQLFALGNLVVVTLLAMLNQGGVISLWCVWAAITSVVIHRYVRQPDSRVGEPIATQA